MGLPPKQGLYDPRNEHDACGVGFVVNIKGRKSNDLIRSAPADSAQPRSPRAPLAPIPWSGDGAGCLIQTPDRLLRDWAAQNKVDLPPPGHYAVAMCFLPQDAKARDFARPAASAISSRSRARRLLGWRDVPTDTTGLGKTVLEQMPVIRQAIVGRGPE